MLLLAGGLFTAGIVLAAAGWWLPAAGLMWPLGWLAGRWDARLRIAALTADRDRARADVEQAKARIASLEDELTFRYGRQHAGRYADDTVLLPDDRDWVSRNHNSTTRSGADMAVSRTTTPA